MLALDARSRVWTFCNWGRPFCLISERVDCHISETTPVQAEAGWSFSAVLTESGDVLVYWQSSGSMGKAFKEKMSVMDGYDGSGESRVRPDKNYRIQCATWQMEQDPFRLRPIPDLPLLQSNGLSEKEQAEPTKLVRIAGMDNVLMGLTNKGHVLKYDGLHDERSFDGVHWEYVRS